MDIDYKDIADKAIQVLEGNWMGHSTKPAPNLYPHQWSWDSAFFAIGYAHYNQQRAEAELRSLFKGQWRNGMLPHIVFNPAINDYHPGPEFWRTDLSPYASRNPLTSGIMQPPLHAMAVWHIYEHGKDRKSARKFLEEMFPKLRAWHEYLYKNHQPEENGLLYIRHPWGSGQDNSPIWDRVLNHIRLRPEDVPQYRRVDTEIVGKEDRPSNEEYDRYAYLVKVAYENGYDEQHIRKVCPFLIQDVLFNSAAVKANQDLAEIAKVLNQDPEPYQIFAELTSEGMNSKLWNEENSIYFDWDMVADSPIDAHVASGFIPLFAGVPNKDQAIKISRRLDSNSFCRLDNVCLAVPSYDKEKPGYSPNRYWRGPIWININYMLYHGLRHYGLDDYAERVKASIIKLTQQCGLYEYYDPDTGQGHGASNFSWTASLLLDLLYEEEGME